MVLVIDSHHFQTRIGCLVQVPQDLRGSHGVIDGRTAVARNTRPHALAGALLEHQARGAGMDRAQCLVTASADSFRTPKGRVVRVGRVAACVCFIAIEDAVFVPVDTDAMPRAERHTRVGNLVPRQDAQGAQSPLGHRRHRVSIALECAVTHVEEAHTVTRARRPLGHQLAVTRISARQQQRDAWGRCRRRYC